MSLAILARCDVAGGLAAMTREVHRHLHPQRTLLVDLGERGRGDCSVESFVAEQHRGMEIYQAEWQGALPTRAIEWLASEGVQTIWSAEVLYDNHRILRAARQNGIRVVVHAMPELAPWATTAPDRLDKSAPRPEIAIPTTWRADTLPGARLLPVPVARDRLPYRPRTNVEHLYHVTGAAMADRNGTQLLLAALPHVTRACQLTIRSERQLRIPPCKVDVTVITERAENYWESIPDADLLVLPRRYGGLSLPIQECASLGIPTLLLEGDPYVGQGGAIVVASSRGNEHRMKGGMVPVRDADPREIANAIDQTVDGLFSADIPWLSSECDRWAEHHAWHGPLGDEWCEYLQADCAREEAAA